MPRANDFNENTSFMEAYNAYVYGGRIPWDSKAFMNANQLRRECARRHEYLQNMGDRISPFKPEPQAPIDLGTLLIKMGYTGAEAWAFSLVLATVVAAYQLSVGADPTLPALATLFGTQALLGFGKMIQDNLIAPVQRNERRRELLNARL